MRILFLTHRLPYAPNRGDRIRAYHLLRMLAAEHQVHVVSFVHDRDESARVNELGSMVASVDGVRLYRPARMVAAGLALGTSRPLTHVLLHTRRMYSVLGKTVGSVRPDVVVTYCTGMARYAVEPPLNGIPWLLDMVDVDSEKWAALADTGTPGAKSVYGREARLLRDFEQLAVKRAFATTVVTEKERELLARIAPDGRVTVAGNGVDLTWFAPPYAPSRESHVIFCGVFNYGPNEAGARWLASEIWPIVKRAEPRARLALVGMHPTRAVRALARDPSIHVTGAVADVRPFLWESAVAVAPLLVARGVQNKVLEAIGAGLPCVVSPAVFEGLPVCAQPACRTAASASAFADAIIQVLRETPDARRLTAERANLRQLSWESQLRPFLDLVERAAANCRWAGSA